MTASHPHTSVSQPITQTKTLALSQDARVFVTRTGGCQPRRRYFFLRAPIDSQHATLRVDRRSGRSAADIRVRRWLSSLPYTVGARRLISARRANHVVTSPSLAIRVRSNACAEVIQKANLRHPDNRAMSGGSTVKQQGPLRTAACTENLACGATSCRHRCGAYDPYLEAEGRCS